MAAPTAILLPIGNEILSGKTRDTNSAFLAGRLTQRGIQVRRILVLPDELDVLVPEIRTAAAAADLLITTGGIGATADDVTRQAVAAAFGRPLVRNPEAVAMMARPGEGYEAESIRYRMADLPEGCRLIPNPITQAPGFILANTYVLPGVPELLRVMFESIEPELPGAPVAFGELQTWHHEGEYATIMEEALRRFPGVNIGSYPKLYHSDYACLVTFTAPSQAEVDACQGWFQEQLDALPPRAPRR
ncbi:MAG TPA: competence/damage-inducible protein A [bacterium]|nr:competence/damage-inducible protein A [bacterium]